MTQLLAMSFDNTSSPSISLKMRKISKVARRRGWGLAWYPSKDSAAAVVKDPESIGDNAMTKVLNEWKRFRSTVFVSHIVGAAQRRTQQDTHPFVRSYAGCSWVFAHNGTLERGYEDGLQLGPDPIYEPMGRTDSEHAFCWLMGQLRLRKIRRLADLGWEDLHKLFRQINQFGTTNLLLTDGHDLVAYRDKNAFRQLYWIRRIPPHAEVEIGNEQFGIDVSDALDVNRTMVFFSSSVLSKEEWHLLPPGEMIVARRGQIRWSSAKVETMAQPLSASIALAQSGLSTSIHSQNRQDSSVAQTEKEERILTAFHETTYTYKDPVELSNHMLRLKPINDENQELLDFKLEVSPDCMSIDFEDVFGNRVTRLEIEEDYTKWRVVAKSKVRVKRAHSLRTYYPERMTIPLVWMPWQREMMQPYLLPPELAPSQLRELSEFALSFVERQDTDLVETLLDMNKTIYRDFKYIPNSTNLETTPFEVYSQRRGVCQDFANLLICLARLLNIPARYRVGYIYTGGNYENKMQSDASHAWAELYLPWIGWQGFDPTNGCIAGLDHIRVACGRNYRDATPTAGTIYRGGGGETLSINVRIEDEAEQLKRLAKS